MVFFILEFLSSFYIWTLENLTLSILYLIIRKFYYFHFIFQKSISHVNAKICSLENFRICLKNFNLIFHLDMRKFQNLFYISKIHFSFECYKIVQFILGNIFRLPLHLEKSTLSILYFKIRSSCERPKFLFYIRKFYQFYFIFQKLSILFFIRTWENFHLNVIKLSSLYLTFEY